MTTRVHMYFMIPSSAAEPVGVTFCFFGFFNLCSFPVGITRFDLLGDFGRYNWLGNFYVVFLYNMMFAGLTSASLTKTVTWAVRRELIRAFG